MLDHVLSTVYTLAIEFSHLRSSKERNVNFYRYFDSRKVVGKNVLVTIPKGNIGYDKYNVS